MIIEAAPGIAIVSLSREELNGYGIEYSSMSLSGSGTRTMLSDMLRMLEHIGIITKRSGTRLHVTVECAGGTAGGCMLFLGISERTALRFSGADQVSRAARAGAFTRDMLLAPDRDGYILSLPPGLEWWRECLIREFADENGSG